MERGETAFLASPTQSCGSCCFGKGGGGILASNNRGELLGASSAFPLLLLLLTSSFAAAAKRRGIEGRAEMVRSPPLLLLLLPREKREHFPLFSSSSPFRLKRKERGDSRPFPLPFLLPFCAESILLFSFLPLSSSLGLLLLFPPYDMTSNTSFTLRRRGNKQYLFRARGKGSRCIVAKSNFNSLENNNSRREGGGDAAWRRSTGGNGNNAATADNNNSLFPNSSSSSSSLPLLFCMWERN